MIMIIGLQPTNNRPIVTWERLLNTREESHLLFVTMETISNRTPNHALVHVLWRITNGKKSEQEKVCSIAHIYILLYGTLLFPSDYCYVKISGICSKEFTDECNAHFNQPITCVDGHFNVSQGYRLVPGDKCVMNDKAINYLPKSQTCSTGSSHSGGGNAEETQKKKKRK